MIKNLLLLILIIFTAYTAYWLNKNEQLDSFITAAKIDIGLIQDIVVEEEEPTMRDGWLTYANDEYGFALQYPTTWEVQETLKPQTIGAIHEISIQEIEYDTHRASFTIRFFENNNGQSVNVWWASMLAEEDAKKEACIEENGDTAPCLFLRDRIEEETEIQLAGKPGYKVNLFQFDSQGECQYVTHGIYIIGLCFDSENPNDSTFDENSEFYAEILSSFELTQIKQAEKSDDDMLIGTWQSAEDSLAFKTFKSNGDVEDGYDGEVLISGTWKINKEEGMSQLLVTIDDAEELFTIVSVNEGALVLTYVVRGNTLTYIRDKGIE